MEVLSGRVGKLWDLMGIQEGPKVECDVRGCEALRRGNTDMGGIYPGQRKARRKLPRDSFLMATATETDETSPASSEQGRRHEPYTKRRRRSDVTMACDSA